MILEFPLHRTQSAVKNDTNKNKSNFQLSSKPAESKRVFDAGGENHIQTLTCLSAYAKFLCNTHIEKLNGISEDLKKEQLRSAISLCNS